MPGERERLLDNAEPAGTDDRARELFARLADWVVQRRMAAPAILFLESHRPLSFIGSQALIAASPIVSFFEPFFRGLLGKNYSHADYRLFAELMEDRDNLERLVIEIERKSQEAKEREQEEKARRKALKREAKEKRKALKRARRNGAGG
jgi:hypothetical protein